MSQQLETLLSELAAQRGLDTPQREEDGRFFLLLDGELEVGLFQHGNHIVIEGPLGPVPEEQGRAEALLVRALRTRFARVKRRREVLSIDPEGGELVLFRELPVAALDVAGLERAIAGLAGGLEYWRDQLARDTAPVRPTPAMQILFP